MPQLDANEREGHGPQGWQSAGHSIQYGPCSRPEILKEVNRCWEN